MFLSLVSWSLISDIDLQFRVWIQILLEISISIFISVRIIYVVFYKKEGLYYSKIWFGILCLQAKSEANEIWKYTLGETDWS